MTISTWIEQIKRNQTPDLKLCHTDAQLFGKHRSRLGSCLFGQLRHEKSTAMVRVAEASDFRSGDASTFPSLDHGEVRLGLWLLSKLDWFLHCLRKILQLLI
jgi:hypothetical protein